MSFSLRVCWFEARDFSAYILVSSSFWLLSWLPPRFVYAVARAGGFLAYIACGGWRRTALRNLDIAFRGALTHRQKCRMTRVAFQHAAASCLGVVCRERWLRRDNLQKFFIVPAQAAAILETGLRPGVAILSAHAGDWEMVHHYLGLCGVPVQVVTRPLANRHLNRRLERLRSRHGAGIIQKRGALRKLRQALAEGRTVGLLADQNCPRRERFFPFFGVPASTYTEYARLLARTGSRVLFIACLRRGLRCRFEILVKDLGAGLPAFEDRPERERHRLKADEIVRRYLGATEKVVREHPEQYLWMHRRWKSRPTGHPWLYHDLGKPLVQELLDTQGQDRL